MTMPSYRPKLIVLRGNSGSGKSTTARALRMASARKIAVVEQDYLRRFVLKEKDRAGGDNIALIEQVTEFALARGYHVILEGILSFARYGQMLTRLRAQCPSSYRKPARKHLAFKRGMNGSATRQPWLAHTPYGRTRVVQHCPSLSNLPAALISVRLLAEEALDNADGGV